MLSLPGDRVTDVAVAGEMISTPSSSPAVPVRPCVYKGHHRTSRPLFAIVAPRRDRRVIILGDGDPVACRLAGGHPAAQSRPVGGDQAAPDPVLADVPVLQG